MNISHQSLRVLVTAGASGIGRTTAELLLARGAQLHVCDSSADHIEELRATLPDIGVTQADVAQPADVERIFAEADSHLGGLDVLVNNAGIAGPTAPVEDISPEDWERTVAVNLNGQFLCTRRAVPRLRASGGGSIINLSSVAGRLGYPLRTPYAASKWAVVGFSKSLAAELGPDGIRVNAILPGPVEGPRIRRVMEAKANSRGVSYEEIQDEYLNLSSLRQMVTREDVAQMICFLCSDAGRHISGQALSVCGDVQRLI